MKVVLNIVIQLLWLALCLFLGYKASIALLPTSHWIVQGLLTGGIAIVAYAAIVIATNIIKATKDPDVITASDLRMDVRRYKQYREWYDEHQRLMREYGINSKEEQAYFLQFFKQIKNPNEWRRYQNYRLKQAHQEM